MITANKISVIMSVYNGQEFLSQSIESILNQSISEFEFIIINDNSTDDTPNILKEYSEKDERIKIITNSNNLGLTKSLNIGIANAKGKYIARQDSDDISKRLRFETQYEYLNKNNDIFLCGTNFDYIDEQNNIIPQRDNDYLNSIEKIYQILPKKNCFAHTSLMFRNRNIYFREKFYFSQDYDLYLNLLSKKIKMINLPEKLVLWRFTPHAISYKNKKKQNSFASKAREFYFQRINKGFDDYDKFSPNTILNIKSKDESKKLHLESKITLLLKNNRPGEAMDIYSNEYSKLDEVNWINKMILLIFIKFPIVYKIYRKIRYNRQ